MVWVVRRCQVSILLVGDKQSEYAFHQLGYRSRKNADDLLEMPDNIDFFNGKRHDYLLIRLLWHTGF
jgi:hypothetical protein